MSVLVAVTDHSAERFRQRVGSRTGALDVKPEVVARVGAAWDAGRVSAEPPSGATGARGPRRFTDALKDSDRAVAERSDCQRDRERDSRSD